MKLPYKYRGLMLLMALVVLLPWAAWRFALKDTLTTWRDCRRAAAQIELLPETTVERPAVVAEVPELVLSGALLDTVRRAAVNHTVQITGYEPHVTSPQSYMAVHTAQLTMTGGFTDLLQVVEELERALPHCRLRTLEWRTATERRSRRTQLVLTVYIEQMILKK